MGFIFRKHYVQKKTDDTGGGDVIDSNGYNYIDLGLSIIWATCNIGSSNPEDYGEYYTWGGSINKSTSDYYTGRTDLPISYDTARQKMGGEWRMPTRGEFIELINGCDRSWTTLNNVNGYLLTSKTNSNTIFFPANGQYSNGSVNTLGTYGSYWSSTWNRSVLSARFMDFNSSGIGVPDYFSIDMGLAVRGVIEKQIEYTYVDLGLSVLWATCNVGATSPEEYGGYYNWGSSINMSDSDYYKEFADLPIEYDTARNKMGGEWRMPTTGELQELISNTTRSWTTLNNVNGYLFTSKKNSKTIFFPAAGSYYDGSMAGVGSNGDYWTSSWYSGSTAAHELRFSVTSFAMMNNALTYGQSVRGVHPK